MSIAFDPRTTSTGVAAGARSVKNTAIDGRTPVGAAAGMRCSSTTRSLPRGRIHGRSSGATIGPRPGAHPRKMPSGSCTSSVAIPSKPGLPSMPSRARDARRAIDADDRVVHRRARRLELQRAHEARLGRRQAEHEVAKDVVRTGFEPVRLRAAWPRDRVCRAATPLGHVGAAGRSASIALGCAARGPALRGLHGAIGQASLADKRRLAVRRQPRRHASAALPRAMARARGCASA